MTNKGGRLTGSRQQKKRYVVYEINGEKKEKIGKYKTFKEMASDLNLTEDQCQNLYYSRTKKLNGRYKIKKLDI
jgi:hypothetical protein